MRFTRERTLFPPLWTDKFCDKAVITSKKNTTLEQKWLCNKQMLIGYHEKLNLFKSSEILKRQNARSSKYQVHSVRAHITVSFVHNGGRNMLRNAFLAITEHSVCFCKGWTFFSFYIIIKTILLRKCFEYAHTITRDWIYFESGLYCQSPK